MTNEEIKAYYSAFKSKDSRFDGQFFVGVKSTGIYCRPICPARLPKEENCVFFKTSHQAESAGFRPCLVCRPELAPRLENATHLNEITEKAIYFIEENLCTEFNVNNIAEYVQCSRRHLDRVFKEDLGISVSQYIQTQRLLLAKNLLTDTNLSVTQTAMAYGFKSLRSFNETFKNKYRMSPTKLRKNHYKTDNITLKVPYTPPYRWDLIIDFLSKRVIDKVEMIKDNTYYRTVSIDFKGKKYEGWLKVENNPKLNCLFVTMNSALIPVLSKILHRIKIMFDVYCRPEIVREKLKSIDEIKNNAYIDGIRIVGCFNIFEMCVRAILGQQITVKAAGTLAGRLAKNLGKPITTEIEGLEYIFPDEKTILDLEDNAVDKLGELGVISARAKTIYTLAQKLYCNEINLNHPNDITDTIKQLTQISGIGEWTAGYIAMRACCFTDIFLPTDYGIKKALAPMSKKEMIALSENWRPWRSYATMILWNSL